MKLSELIPHPNNPRTITKFKLEQLGRSIKEFPEGMELDPILIDEHFIILRGNMRYRALIEAGVKEIPGTWVKQEFELTDKQKKRFLYISNSHAGKFDWDYISSHEDENELKSWGIDVPIFETVEELIKKEKEAEHLITIECESNEHKKKILSELPKKYKIK